MSAISSVLGFLINIFFSLYIFALLVRLLMQKTRVNWHNPVTQFVIKITEPIIKPLRQFIPGYKGFDLSIVALCFILEIIELWILIALQFKVFPNLIGIFIMAVGELGIKTANIFIYATIIAAIMSWFTMLRYSPLAVIVYAFSEPLLQWVRTFVPLIGGLDLSPMIVVLGLLLINAFVFNKIVLLGTAFL